MDINRNGTQIHHRPGNDDSVEKRTGSPAVTICMFSALHCITLFSFPFLSLLCSRRHIGITSPSSVSPAQSWPNYSLKNYLCNFNQTLQEWSVPSLVVHIISIFQFNDFWQSYGPLMIFISRQTKFEGGILESSYGRSVRMSVGPLQYLVCSVTLKVLDLESWNFTWMFVSMCCCAPWVSRLNSFSCDGVIALALVKISTF